MRPSTGSLLGQLLRIDPVFAAPGTLARFVQRRRREDRLKPGGRCPGPLASGPGQRSTPPALQGRNPYTDFTRNRLHRCTLRRQQPRHRSVFEFLSVSRQLVLSSSPPNSGFYRGGNYSDAGGCRRRYPGREKPLDLSTTARMTRGYRPWSKFNRYTWSVLNRYGQSE